MSSGLRKSTKSRFIPPLLPNNMDNMENDMDTDNLDLASSYPAPGQIQQDTSPGYDSDPDLELNETTLVSSASKVEDYKKTMEASIKEVDTLMFQRHRIATIKHSIDQVDANSENPTLPAFMSFQLTFTASCDEASQALFMEATKELHQKGLAKLLSTLQDTCAQIIRGKNEEIKRRVAETKTKLSIKEAEAGPHRAKFFTNLEALRQKWAEKINSYKQRAHGRTTEAKRSRPNQPRPWSRGRGNGHRNPRTSQPSVINELKKLTKMLQDTNNK